MKKAIIICLCGIMGIAESHAQQWDLQQCIDYAIGHNIALKQRENQCKQTEIQLSTAKNSRLPDLNAGASESFSFGRGLTRDNTYSNTNTNSTGFNLSTSVPILTGNRIPNTIKATELNLQATTADLEKAREDISVQVAQQYIQIIYDMEIIGVTNRQIAIDSLQCERLAEMMKNGKASLAELSQQQAALAQSRLNATQADNQYHLDILSLTQLLELPSPEGFSIVMPTVDGGNIERVIPSPDLIFSEAVNIKPSVAAEQLRLKASEKSILIAKSALYPSLSLSAGLGTAYYNSSGYHADGFMDQMRHNFSQNIGISLNVPIFNRFSTRNQVRSAQIDRDNQQLALDNVKKALYKEIQQVHYNTIAASAKYKSSQQAEKSSQDAFNLMQAKYEAGKANITEFNEAKNSLMRAQSDLAQARYELIYQYALVNFYQGKGMAFE